MTELDLTVKEDKSHPARFFLEAGGATLMEVGVVDSDYDNWAIVWAQSNGNCKLSRFPSLGEVNSLHE